MRKSNKEATTAATLSLISSTPGAPFAFYILAEMLPLENPLLTDIKRRIGKKIQVSYSD